MAIKILYVEDNTDSAAFLRVLLHSDECEVHLAETMAEGLQLAQTGGFHLYIVDHSLPDGTGVELCQKIKQFDVHTPVVFFSALGSKALVSRALAAGAHAYLIKPLGLEELKQIVARLLAAQGDVS